MWNKNYHPTPFIRFVQIFLLILIILGLGLLFTQHIWVPKLVGYILAKDQTAELNRDVEGWKTYKNEKYGFELKYPAEILGKELTIRPATFGFADDVEITDGANVTFSVSPQHLSSFIFPPKKVMYGNGGDLSIGVDFGGQGGYIYDPNEKLWQVRNFNQGFDYSEKLTWNELFDKWKTKDSKDFSSFVNGGTYALATIGDAYELMWSGYFILNQEHDLMIRLNHNYSYLDTKTGQQLDQRTIENREKSFQIILYLMARSVEFR